MQEGTGKEQEEHNGLQIRKAVFLGAWVAQSIKLPTLGFTPGHDVTTT